MDTLNNFEIFMISLSTPFILAALWHMYKKYSDDTKQNHTN